MSYTKEQLQRMRSADRKAKLNAERYEGCTLGEARICDNHGSVDCKRCGWNINEVQRRKELPLWRKQGGPWHKRIGVRKPRDEGNS